MKKTSVYLVVIVILVMMTLVLSGCSGSVGEIKTGVYYSSERFVSLTIGEDETFILNRDIATSYDPTGSYTIEGDKLLLKSNEGIIEFKISDDMLTNKNIVVCACGGIAVYKVVDVVSKLKKQNANVFVVMSE